MGVTPSNFFGGVMSKHHIAMAKAGGSNLSHFAAYRNSFYAGVVIRHFVAKTTHFLLIEKNRKCVDLVQLNNATLSQASQAAELLFEV